MGVKGKLITFEGSEGSGKSTQIKLIYAHLKRNKKNVLLLREPGGVKLSEKIRQILLDVKSKGMAKECEMLLYMAARAQLVAEVIEPALKRGIIILCDRFLDSTIVYQGYGCGMDIELIKRIGEFATRRVKPDLTFFFDIGTKQGLQRILRKKDRIESRPLSYHNRVRNGYRKLARMESARIKLISGTLGREEIHQKVKAFVNQLLGIEG